MSLPIVLCVAEKPSLALSIAKFLSDGQQHTRRGGQGVHEFERRFKGAHCLFRVTAVIGHVLTIGKGAALFTYANFAFIPPNTTTTAAGT